MQEASFVGHVVDRLPRVTAGCDIAALDEAVVVDLEVGGYVVGGVPFGEPVEAGAGSLGCWVPHAPFEAHVPVVERVDAGFAVERAVAAFGAGWEVGSLKPPFRGHRARLSWHGCRCCWIVVWPLLLW